MAPDFDVETLDALVTIDVINAAILEAEAKIEPGRVNIKGKGPAAQASDVKGTSNATIETFSHIVEGGLSKKVPRLHQLGEASRWR